MERNYHHVIDSVWLQRFLSNSLDSKRRWRNGTTRFSRASTIYLKHSQTHTQQVYGMVRSSVLPTGKSSSHHVLFRIDAYDCGDTFELDSVQQLERGRLGRSLVGYDRYYTRRTCHCFHDLVGTTLGNICRIDCGGIFLDAFIIKACQTREKVTSTK